MEERRRAVSPKRVEHLPKCAKRSLECHWRSTAVILFAGDVDQHVQQLLGCAIVGTLEELETQSVWHRNASLAVQVSKAIEKRPIQHGFELYPEVGDSVTRGKAAYPGGVRASTSPAEEAYAVTDSNVMKLGQAGPSSVGSTRYCAT